MATRSSPQSRVSGGAASPSVMSFRQGATTPMLPASPTPISRSRTSTHTTLPNGENPWISVFRHSGLSPVFQRETFSQQSQHRSMATPNPTPQRSSANSRRAIPLDIAQIAQFETNISPIPQSEDTDGRNQEMMDPNNSFSEDLGFSKGVRTVSSLSDYYLAKRGQTSVGQRGATGSFLNETRSSVLSGYDTVRSGTQKLGFSITADTSLEDAERILHEFKTKRLEPPKTYWEEPDARQKVIDAVESQNIRENEPGGSWVNHAGDIPASRSLPKNPDKILLDTKMTKDRKKMLTNLRWQFHVSKMNTFHQVFNYFRRNSIHETEMPIQDFFGLLKAIQFELTTDREYNLAAMFKGDGETSINFERFCHMMFDETKGELPIGSSSRDVDPDQLAIMMRQSTAFNDLTVLRPRSRSGRIYNLSDVSKQVDKPLVLPSGTQKTPSKIQFLSDREQQMYEVRKHEVHQRKPTAQQELSASVSPKRDKRAPAMRLESRSSPQSPVNDVELTYEKRFPDDVNMAVKPFEAVAEPLIAPPEPKPKIPPALVVDTTTQEVSLPAMQSKSPSRSPNYRRTLDGTYRRGSNSGHLDLDGNPLEQNLEKPKPIWKRMNVPHAPNWSLVHRTEMRPADMTTKISHNSHDGGHLANTWESTNLCNKALPEDARRRITLANLEEQKKNASKGDVNWSYAHSGMKFDPTDWTSTSQDQQRFSERARTPHKLVFEPSELREPPWSVAERHLVHLQQYDHRIVGLKRPEPLAGKS